MRTALLGLVAALAFVVPAAHACNEHDHGKGPKQRASAQRSALVAGEVREVDLEGRTITLGHGKIASLRMAPMSSMVFRTADRVVLDGFEPGDKVRFRVAMIDRRPTVTEIRRAGS